MLAAHMLGGDTSSARSLFTLFDVLVNAVDSACKLQLLSGFATSMDNQRAGFKILSKNHQNTENPRI